MTNGRKTWFSTVWGTPENPILCSCKTGFQTLYHDGFTRNLYSRPSAGVIIFIAVTLELP